MAVTSSSSFMTSATVSRARSASRSWTRGAKAGTAIGVLAYAGETVTAHVTVAAGGMLDGTVDAWGVHAGITGTFNILKVRGAIAADSTGVLQRSGVGRSHLRHLQVGVVGRSCTGSDALAAPTSVLALLRRSPSPMASRSTLVVVSTATRTLRTAGRLPPGRCGRHRDHHGQRRSRRVRRRTAARSSSTAPARPTSTASSSCLGSGRRVHLVARRRSPPERCLQGHVQGWQGHRLSLTAIGNRKGPASAGPFLLRARRDVPASAVSLLRPRNITTMFCEISAQSAAYHPFRTQRDRLEQGPRRSRGGFGDSCMVWHRCGAASCGRHCGPCFRQCDVARPPFSDAEAGRRPRSGRAGGTGPRGQQ